MTPTRRSFLATAGIGLAAARLLRPVPARAETLLIQPTALRSSNGELNAALAAAPATIRLGDVSVEGLVYNGSYLPPLLRVRLGDVMNISLHNGLADDPTNLHFHGMAVSPKANSDNVFVHVHPGDSFQYKVSIPAHDRQSAGMFWYHPHVHGVVTEQILGGMSGGLVVDGSENYFPILKDLPERFLLIKHFEHTDGEIISINGQVNPVVPIRPGEVQFWRIAHIGASLFLKLRIHGMPLYIIATDGHPRSAPQPVTELFIGPGERVDALVIGPSAGEYPLESVPFVNQAWKPPDPGQQIATIVASGPPATAQPHPGDIAALRVQGARWIDEIRRAPIAHRRTISYSRTPDRKQFMIDGKVVDMDRVDQTVKLGDTEEWTIVNTDQQFHSFHIHQTAFLVTEINGVPQNEDSLRDTFSTPPATEIGPGSLKVVIPFTDPVIVGKFVYHCHAVDHEDKGMMAVIEVIA